MLDVRCPVFDVRFPVLMTPTEYNRPLHVLALLTAAATFPLIFMGGLVTSHGAGMSVPDWPNSYGYNMFTFPPSKWVGGIFYEHTHRLMGAVVGMLSIALTVVAWRTESRRWVRWLATGVLAAVIFQGVLGGLRVVMVELDLAIVHACFAQAFFCLAAMTSVVTSRWWLDAPDLSRGDDAIPGRRLILACVFASAAIFAQLIVGATMRHYRAGLAIPDFPLSYGSIVPPISDAGLQTANEARAWTFHMEPVSMQQVWLHYSHRVGAVLVSIAVIVVVARILRHHAARPVLVRGAALLVALLLTQITLGAFTVWKQKPADVASAHVAVGALTLMTAFVLTVRAMRLYGARRATCSADRIGGTADAIRGFPEDVVPA
jgi:cytochrome c oxidase assembly protein subunit 15